MCLAGHCVDVDTVSYTNWGFVICVYYHILVWIINLFLKLQANSECNDGGDCVDEDFQCYVSANVCIYKFCDSNQDCPGDMQCRNQQCIEQFCSYINR